MRRATTLLAPLLLASICAASASSSPAPPPSQRDDDATASSVTVYQQTGVKPVVPIVSYAPPAIARKASSRFVRIAPLPLKLPNIPKLVALIRTADRASLAPQLTKARSVIAFFQGRRWVTAPNQSKCWDVPWQRLCTMARAQLRLNHALAETAQYRLDHELPLINDWRTAVRWVQRIYPGTESWMLYISDREGGWGPWVWYGGRHWSGYHVGNDFLGADTVGGWMQFRYSTFAPYWRHAQENLRQRGYVVPLIPMPPEGGPSRYAAWLSPLAQALTAGYMKYYGREGCHWCL